MYHNTTSFPLTGRPGHQLWLLLGLLLGLISPLAYAQNGPACSTYINKRTANGLGSNNVQGVYAVGSTVYAATQSGVSISTNGGVSFTNKTTANGLGNNNVNGVYAIGSTVYAATTGGLSISTDGGASFTNKTTANGLGSNFVYGVYIVSGPGSATVYAATLSGLGISTDGGATFTNKTNANSGLGGNLVYGVYAVGSTVYAATDGGGLGISTDGGASFTNKTTANGLGNNLVFGVYVVGSTVYAATFDGLSISTDGGASFTNKTTANGLGNNLVRGVYAIGSTVYATTNSGLSISTNGGASFTNYTTANGLGSNILQAVYALGNTIFAGTFGGLSSCADAALPVTLLFFNGRNTPQGNLLEWKTTQESDNAGFTILRGADPNALEAIATIPSQAQNGNATTTLAYQFIDAQPTPTLTYYRLQQSDFSGQRTLSNLIAIRNDDQTPMLFPNPAPLSGVLRLVPPQPFDRYEWIDASGKTLYSVEQPGTLSEVSLPTTTAGVYLLRLQSGTTRQLYRILR